VTRPLVSLLDAFVPALCISCKAVGSLFCSQCRSHIRPQLHTVERQGFVGLAAHNLDAEVGNLILAFKDRGRTALGDYLARLLVPAFDVLRVDDVHLVALPSSHQAIKRRGYNANAILAKVLAQRTRTRCIPDAIKLIRQPGDQRGLSAEERVRNLHGSMLAKPGGSRVLLIDDVVTSGASLLEGRRALVEAGFEVVGFITIAETLLENTNKIGKSPAGRS